MLPNHVTYTGNLNELREGLQPCGNAQEALHTHLKQRTDQGQFIHLYGPSRRSIDAFVSGEASQLVIDQTFSYGEDQSPTIGGLLLSHSADGVQVSSHT